MNYGTDGIDNIYILTSMQGTYIKQLRCQIENHSLTNSMIFYDASVLKHIFCMKIFFKNDLAFRA